MINSKFNGVLRHFFLPVFQIVKSFTIETVKYFSGFQFFIVAIISAFVLLGYPKHVLAQNEFSTSVFTEYNIDNRGVAHVEKTFQLKNNLSTVYVTRYAIEVSSNRLQNVTATDSTGQLKANVVQTDNTTSIGLDFSDKIVGKDQVREFTLSYDDPDAAILTGKILEVRIPRLADPEEFQHYEVKIIAPPGFNAPAIANPEGFTVEQVRNRTQITYADSGLDEGISLIFGEEQQYEFSLNYHLLNPSGSRGITQIALPPDTQYQKVVFDDIQPRPQKIERDIDGNWIATYLLESKQEQTVTASGTVTVYLEPTLDIPQSLPSEELLKEDKHWQISDPKIQELAQQYKTPQQIYDYVIDTLDYNYQRLEPESEPIRLGAVDSLAQPTNAVCQEFADLFITLARANGIPARLAVGYAFTQNPQIRPLSLVEDILHAWPEYYDIEKKVWIPVDPTWGDTTGGLDYFTQFDFNHVVFAIQGHSSEKPYPAGSYKRQDVESRDVQIEPINKEQQITQKFTLSLNPVNVKIPWRNTLKLNIQNETGQAWYAVPATISVDSTIHTTRLPEEIQEILPYQLQTHSLLVSSNDWIRPQQTHFFAQVGEDTLQEQITVAPQVFQFLGRFGYSSVLQLMIFGLTAIGIVLFFVIIARFFHNRKSYEEEE